jgi:hypothetical protein
MYKYVVVLFLAMRFNRRMQGGASVKAEAEKFVFPELLVAENWSWVISMYFMS